MKKSLLTAALGCLALSPALAGTGDRTISHNGTLAVVVNDYITMVPNGPFAAGLVTFNNPQQMVDGWQTTGTVTIVASRAWKYEYSSTDFERATSAADPLPAGVSQTVPTGNIWLIATGNGTAGVNTTGGNLIGSSNSPVNMANQGTGTLSSSFDLTGKLVPGLTNQMSGTYNTAITQLASLQ